MGPAGSLGCSFAAGGSRRRLALDCASSTPARSDLGPGGVDGAEGHGGTHPRAGARGPGSRIPLGLSLSWVGARLVLLCPRVGFRGRRAGRAGMRRGVACAGGIIGAQAFREALVCGPNAASRSEASIGRPRPEPAGRGPAGAGLRASGGHHPAVHPPSGTASPPFLGETARRMTSAMRYAWRTAAERTSMLSWRDRGVRMLSVSGHPVASWIADMLNTAAWLVGRRVHPSGCRKRRRR